MISELREMENNTPCLPSSCHSDFVDQYDIALPPQVVSLQLWRHLDDTLITNRDIFPLISSASLPWLPYPCCDRGAWRAYNVQGVGALWIYLQCNDAFCVVFYFFHKSPWFSTVSLPFCKRKKGSVLGVSKNSAMVNTDTNNTLQ